MQQLQWSHRLATAVATARPGETQHRAKQQQQPDQSHALAAAHPEAEFLDIIGTKALRVFPSLLFTVTDFTPPSSP